VGHPVCTYYERWRRDDAKGEERGCDAVIQGRGEGRSRACIARCPFDAGVEVGRGALPKGVSRMEGWRDSYGFWARIPPARMGLPSRARGGALFQHEEATSMRMCERVQG
jgi:hypothetical protein